MLEIDLSKSHYQKQNIVDQYPDEPLAEANYRNVGWSLGNDCPFSCKQCYSRSAREKGLNLTVAIVDRVIEQLGNLGVETVNLGGNEPIYTNGLNISESHLPYILKSLNNKNIKVGITTAGPTINILKNKYPECLSLINDVDISLDSPRSEEHDNNRGVNGLYNYALRAIGVCEEYGIPRSIIMCGMKWNFTKERINEMIDLCEKTNSNFRVNPLKPVESKHMDEILTPEQYYEGLNVILKRCRPVDLSDPAWASSAGITKEHVSGCPCGTNSFRIHSITPDGTIPISPCVYLHDFKTGNLLVESMPDILSSTSFKIFRQRKANPNLISECSACDQVAVCGGGCASRAYLHNLHLSEGKNKNIFQVDPYCPARNKHEVIQTQIQNDSKESLVHMGYLCTGIFKPRAK